MARLQPIRIGDTFEREYRFYNAIPDTDPPVADTNNPIDLTDIIVTFHLRIGAVTHDFDGSAGVTVTPEDGQVNIELEAEQTADFKRDNEAESYLLFEYADGNEKTKAHRAERVLPRYEIR